MSLVEVVVGLGVAVLVVVLIAVILPMLGGTRHGPPNPNGTHLRGIHQGMVLYSQGNKFWYPGVTKTGNGPEVFEPTIAGRLKPLLDGNYFTSQYLISPGETDPRIKAWSSGPFTAANHSYALLSLNAPGDRRYEWSDRTNTQAAIATDRNTGLDDDTNVQSYWTQTPGDWRGSTVYGDNSVQFLTSPVTTTKYGTTVRNNSDHLFQAPTPDDAWMVHVEPLPPAAPPAATRPASP